MIEMARNCPRVRLLHDLDGDDTPEGGGKNASLREMMAELGERVPGGFATTARAYRGFLDYNDLEKEIRC